MGGIFMKKLLFIFVILLLASISSFGCDNVRFVKTQLLETDDGEVHYKSKEFESYVNMNTITDLNDQTIRLCKTYKNKLYTNCILIVGCSIIYKMDHDVGFGHMMSKDSCSKFTK